MTPIHENIAAAYFDAQNIYPFATLRLPSNEPITPSPSSSFGRRYSIISSTCSALEPGLSGTSSVVSPRSQPLTPVTDGSYSRDSFSGQLIAKLQDVPQKRRTVDTLHGVSQTQGFYPVYNSRQQLPSRVPTQATPYLGSNNQQGCQFIVPYETEPALMSPAKCESEMSTSFHTTGVVSCSFDSGISTASSFSSGWSEVPNGLPGRSFGSGLGTAMSSFSNTWSDADLSFSGTDHSFVEYKSSPQLGELPGFNNWSQTSPVLGGNDLTPWPQQPYTHVAPAQTQVQSTSGLDIRLQVHSDSIHSPMDSPNRTMGIYDSFEDELVDMATDLGLVSTKQEDTEEDPEADVKPYKPSRRSSRANKSRSKHGGKLMQTECSIKKRSNRSRKGVEKPAFIAGLGNVPRVRTKGPHHCHFGDCRQSFVRSEHLKRHFKIHVEEKEFPCPIKGCFERPTKTEKAKQLVQDAEQNFGPRSFNRSDNRYAHIKTHIEKCTGNPRNTPHSFTKVCEDIMAADWDLDKRKTAVDTLKRDRAYGRICEGTPCRGSMCDGNHCAKPEGKEVRRPCYKGDECSINQYESVQERSKWKKSSEHDADYSECS